MKRARLTLGHNESMDLLLALAYAIDTWASDEDFGPDDKLTPSARAHIQRWERLREKIRNARQKAAVR